MSKVLKYKRGGYIQVANRKVKIFTDRREVTTGNGTFNLQPYACIGENDILVTRNKRVFVKCKNGLAQVKPHFETMSILTIGGKKYPIIIKEITDK